MIGKAQFIQLRGWKAALAVVIGIVAMVAIAAFSLIFLVVGAVAAAVAMLRFKLWKLWGPASKQEIQWQQAPETQGPPKYIEIDEIKGPQG